LLIVLLCCVHVILFVISAVPAIHVSSDAYQVNKALKALKGVRGLQCLLFSRIFLYSTLFVVHFAGFLCYSLVDVVLPSMEAAIRGSTAQAVLMNHVYKKVYKRLAGQMSWLTKLMNAGGKRLPTSGAGNTKRKSRSASAASNEGGAAASPAPADSLSGATGGGSNAATESLVSFDRLADGTVVNARVISRAFGGKLAVVTRLFWPDLPKPGCAPVCDSDVVCCQ
jgi:hypothetical protein